MADTTCGPHSNFKIAFIRWDRLTLAFDCSSAKAYHIVVV